MIPHNLRCSAEQGSKPGFAIEFRPDYLHSLLLLLLFLSCRVQLIHDSGHSVPQQSRWMQDILKFVVNFAEIPLPVGHHHKHRHRAAAPAAAAAAAAGGAALQKGPSLHKPGRGAVLHWAPSGKVPEAAAAAAAPVEAAAAEIESKLHRQGLRDKATKGT
jgi:hypothetical protein